MDITRACGTGRAEGWTAIEVLTVCTIVGVLASMAIPHFRELAANARRSDRVYALFRSLHAARSAAILRAQPVVLCPSRDGLQCAPEETSWTGGWIVFANADRRMPPRVEALDVVLHVEPAAQGVSIESNRPALVYWPVSLGATTATIVFCDARGARAARAIVVSRTGRARISDRDGSGRSLTCA